MLRFNTYIVEEEHRFIFKYSAYNDFRLFKYVKCNVIYLRQHSDYNVCVSIDAIDLNFYYGT